MRRLRLILTITAAIAMLACRGNAPSDQPAPAPTPTWSMAVAPLSLPVGADSAEPQLTASPQGTVLSWIEQSDATSTLKFATRAGNAWSTPQSVASGTDWFLSSADPPSVMRTSDGTLVAAWYRTTMIELEAYDLWMSYSKDDGKTWAKPFTPHHDRTKTQHGFASLFETAARDVGVVWLDAREWELNKEAPDGGAVMLRYAAFDPKWKQTADAAVNVRVCDCCTTATAVTAEGAITAFRDRSDTEVRDIAVSRLESGKWTDAAVVHNDGWQIDSCPINGPSISAQGRNVVVGWFSAKDNQGHAFAAFSNDGGRQFGAPVRLDDATSLGYVDVELLDDGSAVASWVEFASGRTSLKARHITGGGEKSNPITITTADSGRVSRYPRMARAGDELIFAWTETSGGEETESGRQMKGAIARLPRTTAP